MKLRLIYSILAIVMISCGPKVNTAKLVDKDLSNYNSFAYLPNSNFDDLKKFETDPTVGTAIIESVNRNMKQKGYELDRNNPDLLVLLSTMTDKERTVDQEPVYATYPNNYGRSYGVSPYYQNQYYYNYSSYSRIIGYERDIDRYKEGTLLIRLVDSDSKEVVWRGSASDAIFKQNETTAIAKFVDDMFDDFPKK
ncbi:DUF4136 domain-containing protein [Subsaximicrobium wynnwilliamsii]|uniref:DUF4136 domain-containing protein n=1 Tax=Subsaximicrobium wynnwilliamsii TaxID=291179 RepID=A0A5C6ZDU6_9FLAO|nr:DUF4136 domain-containing protein [Subsaximicrobium wynnwilliamsii]TXD82442.1 DUF4136 domain-containing protein [Subsaximicrobium wynnwilliamsii]TXD88084.1 DUF4136 domain-containing protein [Subsaximicrobium wynnwilliamsii]TXE02054.1 DUF4136 domain-containing protein [Subsaximicrobium wynnwilliamsii]